MLTTLPLYILRELSKAFAVSLLIYTFIFLVMFCGGVVGAGVTLKTIIEIIPFMFPMMSRLVLPLAIITGILISYGRFSANNEFIAAQASGIHPFWLGVPALIIAFFSSIITIYLNADVMTGAVISMERRILADRTNIINSKLEKPGSFSFRIPGSITFAICRLPNTWNPDGKGTGIDFAIFKQPGTDKSLDGVWDPHYPYPETRILAKDHQIKVTEDEENNMTIIGDFHDAIETSKLGRNIASIQTMPHTSAKFIHPNSGFDLVFDSHRLQYMGIDKLKLVRQKNQNAYIASLQNEENLLKRDFPAALTALKLPLPPETAALLETPATRPEGIAPLRAAWDKFISAHAAGLPTAVQKMNNEVQDSRKNSERHHHDLVGADAEIHVKLVMSFACIFFAFFGIPLAMLGKRGSSTMGFAIGFGFAFMFYMVITALHGAVRDGSFECYVLWFPNVIIAVLSVFLWYRMTRQLS